MWRSLLTRSGGPEIPRSPRQRSLVACINKTLITHLILAQVAGFDALGRKGGKERIGLWNRIDTI